MTWSQQDLKRVEDEPIEKDWVVSQYLSKLTKEAEGRYESTLTIPWNKGQSLYRCFVENSNGNDTRVFKFIRYGKIQFAKSSNRAFAQHENESCHGFIVFLFRNLKS